MNHPYDETQLAMTDDDMGLQKVLDEHPETKLLIERREKLPIFRQSERTVLVRAAAAANINIAVYPKPIYFASTWQPDTFVWGRAHTSSARLS